MGRGSGRREPGREKRAGEVREAGGQRVGRGRDVGEKCKTLLFFIYNVLGYFHKQEPEMSGR